MKNSPTVNVATLVASLVLFVSLDNAYAQVTSVVTDAGMALSDADWHAMMKQRVPSKIGCFEAHFPGTDWEEVACATAPNIPLSPAPIGRGNDYFAGDQS